VNPGPDGQQQRRQKSGITTTGYSLSSPQNCPNGRGHLKIYIKLLFGIEIYISILKGTQNFDI
ncbi:hypothetical protein, partial [Komagataeibacter xylinus]|uniref:hypothetical protein n=1 Tax=Komagataeibacter xylinus TaxID=28448 RepID=UPI0022325B6C